MEQLDRVTISKSIENSSTDWIVIMRYGDLVDMTELSDPESITVPPHDVFCLSDKQVCLLFGIYFLKYLPYFISFDVLR